MNWKRILITSAATVALLAVGYIIYIAVFAQSKIQSEDVNQYIITPPSPTPTQMAEEDDLTDPNIGKSLIYVLIGSDSRDGDNAKVASDKTDGARSDTTMIAHIAEDRSFVDVVSIPRDSIVDIPECRMSDGSTKSAVNNAMFNSSFSRGDTTATSVACTISTIQHNTGLSVDGYVLIDFVGFESVIDAVGGVTMDIPEDMKSKKAKLSLAAGEQTLDGEQALAYARARTFEVGGGVGSDLERISRQQELMSTLTHEILSAGTLANPVRINGLVGSTLDALVVSPDLASVQKLAGMAFSLRDLDSANVNYYTVPVTAWTQDRNRVVWTEDADQMWDVISQNLQLTPDEGSE